MNNKKKLLVLAGIGAVLGYRAWKGLGAFNKIRFKQQRNALLSYVDTHYPGAHIGDIVPFEDGWNCSIHHNNKNIIIHIISNSDDGFIFNSTEV